MIINTRSLNQMLNRARLKRSWACRNIRFEASLFENLTVCNIFDIYNWKNQRSWGVNHLQQVLGDFVLEIHLKSLSLNPISYCINKCSSVSVFLVCVSFHTPFHDSTCFPNLLVKVCLSEQLSIIVFAQRACPFKKQNSRIFKVSINQKVSVLFILSLYQSSI